MGVHSGRIDYRTKRVRAKINYSSQALKRRNSQLHISKFDKANFLAWDGEGLDLNEKLQVYALLANSNGDYISNPEGLTSEECFEMLLSDVYPKDTIHVCFGASYDTNMMFRNIPELLLRRLHSKGRIYWKNKYILDYRPRKSFTISSIKSNGDKRPMILKSVTLWDVFGFFQSKFINVIRTWTKGTIYENKYKDIGDIEKGKAKRGSFSQEELKDFILPYCLRECEALYDIMHILHGYLKELGWKIARWDGAGAIAATVMQMYNVKEHIKIKINDKDYIDPCPARVIFGAEHAYFGGRIETLKFGDINWSPLSNNIAVWHYDERSAYPAKMPKLPSLVMGHWKQMELNFSIGESGILPNGERGNKLPLSKLKDKIKKFPSFWLAHISWDYSKQEQFNFMKLTPFLWRDQSQGVQVPFKGSGWQWSPEIMAAYETMSYIDIWIDELWYFVPDVDCIYPLAFVAELYEKRKEHKRLGLGIEKVEKLAYNSLYGKTAQSIGYSEKFKKPPYHCIVYAGLITSMTRADLIRAAMQAPTAIISFATDGIYSLCPLNLDEGENLGQWEATVHERMTIVQSGFYWYDTNGKEKHYYRGFNEEEKGENRRERIVQAWNNNNHEPIALPCTRFVTLGTAVGLNDFSKHCSWRSVDREIDIWSTKGSKRRWIENKNPMPGPVYFTYVGREKDEYLDDDRWGEESSKYKFKWDEDYYNVMLDGQPVMDVVEDLSNQEIVNID